ncbi:MAG: DUF3822 family protein [Saprospiraceae bacterium]
MGKKINFEIVEDQFVRQISPQNELSILLGVDSLSYMISSPQRQALLLRDFQLTDGQSAFLDLIAQDEYLHAAYRAVRIAAVSPFFTLVPERLYNPDEKSVYLQDMANISYAKDIRADELRTAQARLVYALPQEITNLVQKQLTGGQLFHAVTAFLSGLLHLGNAPATPTLYLHINSNWLLAALIEHKKLLFVNTFHYQNAKDFLYYVLLVLDQYNLTPEVTPTFITGQLIEQSEIYPLLRRYLRTLQFLPSPDFLQFGTKWQQQPTYFYFNLFGLTQL